MFYCRILAVCMLIVGLSHNLASAQESEFSFREYDVHFLTYGLSYSAFSSERTLEVRNSWNDTIESIESETYEFSVLEVGLSYSFQLFEIGNYCALRIEPELRAAISEARSQMGGALPIRLQFGAMSAEQNFSRIGVGLKLGIASMLLPDQIGDIQESLPNGWQYGFIISGIKLGTNTLSLDVEYASYTVTEQTIYYYRQTTHDVEVLTIGITMSSFDL